MSMLILHLSFAHHIHYHRVTVGSPSGDCRDRKGISSEVIHIIIVDYHIPLQRLFLKDW